MSYERIQYVSDLLATRYRSTGSALVTITQKELQYSVVWIVEHEHVIMAVLQMIAVEMVISVG